MTDVLFHYTKPGPDGEEVTVRVGLRFALLHRQEGGGRVLTTNWFDQTVNGPTVVSLLPTDTGQAWQVMEVSGTTDRPDVQTFLVPDDDIVHNFYDLTFVDEDSLGEIDMSDPAWVSAITDIDSRVTVIENLGFPPHTHGVSDINGLPDALSHVHEQNVASASWTIIHDLPYMPNVTIVDSAGSVLYGEVNYLNTTSIQVLFSGAFSGKAYLS